MMLLNTVSTMTSECFLVRSETRETSSTSSAFVMLPLVIGSFACHVLRATCYVRRAVLRATWRRAVRRGDVRCDVAMCGTSHMAGTSHTALRTAHRTSHVARRTLLLPLEVIAERHFGAAGHLRVGFPVRAELLVLERADAETDLPLGRDQLDDLHLVAFANHEIQLPFLARLLRVVELGDVDQSLDAFDQLHERAEVGQTNDLALDRVANVVLREELVPHVGLELLETERQALVL